MPGGVRKILPGVGGIKLIPPTAAPTLKDLGLDKKTSFEAQPLAELPAPTMMTPTIGRCDDGRAVLQCAPSRRGDTLVRIPSFALGRQSAAVTTMATVTTAGTINVSSCGEFGCPTRQSFIISPFGCRARSCVSWRRWPSAAARSLKSFEKPASTKSSASAVLNAERNKSRAAARERSHAVPRASGVAAFPGGGRRA